ncbi:ubiquitin carboxyl-terminal hydrolase 16 [Wyeomyia smithii]|uniref:ubiquitin carboxyl-terminal hydrolase 16 n=1 Tax=Wyeomyia smithii TaxID=174621 RepID=UPI002467C5CC|nr:ubiquitin carboxyl-terminal hydrolase 16 [Wyeomyia smithii]
MVKMKPNEVRDDDSSTESNDDLIGSNHHYAGGGRECCVHVKPSIAPTVVRKVVKSAGLLGQCSKCRDGQSKPKLNAEEPAVGQDEEGFEIEEDSSLWLCLKCGTQLCGRYRSKHALEHFKTPHSDQHALALNTTNLKVWCYACDIHVNPKSNPRLQECVEFVTREASKSKDPFHSPQIFNIEPKLHTTPESLRAVLGDVLPLPAPSGSTIVTQMAGQTNSAAAVPVTVPNYRDIRLDIGGTRKTPPQTTTVAIVDSLPRVRGLSNLGNTCFFNAVLQCLARTPYLLDVLKESAEKGEKFQLPGGLLKLKDGTETELRPIVGELNPWGSLTQALAETLGELQAGTSGVFSPEKLLKQLINKWPQFAGADQHDSHELLRHLLESVRSEDLRRYQLVILLSLGYTKNVDPQSVEDTMKEKIKFYGSQALDRIIRPEPVFRGFLVSTLTCQDCQHISSRHESFLDLSLPVSAEKPQPPIRRKGSPEMDYGYSASSGSSAQATTKQLNKSDRRRLKKGNRVKRDKNLINLTTTGTEEGNAADAMATSEAGATPAATGGGGDAESGADDDGMSDADVEDNLTDDSQPKKGLAGAVDQNGNQALAGTPGNPEKSDDTPENPNKEVSIGDGCNVVCELGLSAEGAVNLMEKMSLNSTDGAGGKQKLDQDAKKLKNRRQRTYSHADWGSTLAPRYQCEDNECSIQSCFNSFTAVELMTGNNKVCCDACTERINGKDGKSVNTNATKQFLISSPPAVLILHLKRFQVGPRGSLRKMTKSVTFPFVLDIAPFCGSRVKKLPNVKPGQKKLLYSLYGIVEHSGTMHGGHYVAYVKVRPQLTRSDRRWEFLPKGSRAELDQEDEEALQLERDLAKEQARQLISNVNNARDSDDALTSSSSSTSRSSTGTATSDGEEEGAVGYTPRPELLPDVEPPPGKWYYVSDSHVRETSEDSVLNAQAYLLFYERFF